MIWYVVTHTTDAFRENRERYRATRTHLEQLADDYATILHYSDVNLETVAALRPWAICHSGGTHGGAKFHAGWQACVETWDGPQIGFCAGHQLAGQVFGSQLGPMRPLHPGEPDPFPHWSPGQYKERGIYDVPIMQPDDPLFAGLGPSLRVWQNHRFQLTYLGPELEILAASPSCPHEAWKHRSRFFYGVQFHPETPVEGSDDGARLLANFFALARQTTE